jgi:hypothetical protein
MSAESGGRKPARKRRTGKRRAWTYSYGPKPYTIFAFERLERGNQVFVRWTNLSKREHGGTTHRREKQSLGIVVRDPATGRLDPKLVRAAELEVQRFHARLITGTLAQTAAERAAEKLPAPPTAETLTLREGFRLALEPKRGKYASIETRRYADMLLYESRLFGLKPGTKPLINPEITWAVLQQRDVRALWRTMAERYVRTDGREFGIRIAEQLVDAIFSVASWLREESHIAPDSARPPDGWRKRLREEWAQRTDEQLHRPHRPRHTVDEFRRIFAALNDPRVDPRIRLAIELAAECRTGQVLRCTRRMLTITDADPSTYESLPAGSLGQVIIPGAGKKHGETVVLTPEQRRAVDDALAGYLANYETSWQNKAIDDFYLFPGSKMRMLDDTGARWTRRVRAGVKPMTRDGARVAFKQLEAIAKVDHIQGRGWYGLRRQAADMAETATTDDRVKDRLGGWQDSETRKSIYQDRETDVLRAQAAHVRRTLRVGRGLVVATDEQPAVVTNPEEEADPSKADLEALWSSLTTEQQIKLIQDARSKIRPPEP